MNQYAACLGIDWAYKKHDLCLCDATTGKKTKQVWPHTPQAIAEYFTNLRLVGRVATCDTSAFGYFKTLAS